jgi:hypothetical protein
MAPTMKSKVHENRNENLHGWRKFEKHPCTSHVSARAQRTALQPFSQVKGFMMPVMKGFMTTPARLHRKLETLRGTNWHKPRTPFGARLVSRRHWPSMVAAEYGSPPEIAGTPAPGSAFMSSLGPWPSIDGRRRCEKSRVCER